MAEWAEPIEPRAFALTVRNNGIELSMHSPQSPPSAEQTVRYYAKALDKIYCKSVPTAGNVPVILNKTPVGVVGAIIPWNVPLMIVAWPLRPALAAGSTVVVKPPEMASRICIAELALSAGLPAGVLK